MARLSQSTAATLELAPAPTASPRVVRKLTVLQDVKAQLAELETRKRDLSEELLRLVKAEGEPDIEGKIRLETDEYKLQIISGESSTIDARLLLQLGVKASVIKRATRHTPFEYVRPDRKKG